MKKVLLAIGLFIFSLIAMAALFVWNAILLVFMLYPAPFITSALAAFGTAGLYKKPCRKYGMKMWVFWIFAFLPPFTVGVGAVAVVCVGLFGAFNVQPYTLELYDLASTCLTYGIFGAIFTRLAVKKFKEVRQ